MLFGLPNVFVHHYRFGGVMRFLYDIPLIARRIKPDIIHTQYVLPLRFGDNAKRHVTLYDVLYEDFPEYFSLIYRLSRRLVFGWSAKRADIISSISEYSRSRIAALYGRKLSDIHLVFPGVTDDEDFCPSGTKTTRENFVLYVSRFEKRKNHLLLLNLIHKLLPLHPGLKLIFVGFEVDGTLAHVREFVKSNKLEHIVDIRSHIVDSELEILYRTAGVVAYPSFAEGFGMPIIESFLLNPNTLFSNKTAMKEFTFSPNNMFDPADEATVALMIDYALRFRNIEPVDWLVQQREIINKYNWKRSAQILARLYHDDLNTYVSSK
jgi:glycosyltransferase involved in cell wall biosynthesis